MARGLSAAAHVFFQSEFCRLGAERYLGTPAGTWEILHNPVDTSAFTPAARPPRPLTLLLGGNQYQRYRLDAALRTVALLDDVRLLVTGDLSWAPDAPAWTAARLRELGIEGRVELLGPYAQRDAPAVLRRADVLLHTKVNDPCPTVVLEAMACGLPVAYSASGGTPELVGEDAGVGVETELDWERDRVPAPEALAGAVLQIATSLEAYAEAARLRAERFDLGPWVERHRQVFEGLVA
jgi:glycosyltransferase involved in cell wall biosynthesis